MLWEKVNVGGEGEVFPECEVCRTSHEMTQEDLEAYTAKNYPYFVSYKSYYFNNFASSRASALLSCIGNSDIESLQVINGSFKDHTFALFNFGTLPLRDLFSSFYQNFVTEKILPARIFTL